MTSVNFNNYFLGEINDLKNKAIVNYYDINYIPLKNLPITYFSLNNINDLFLTIANIPLKTNIKNIIDKIFKKLNKSMDNNNNNFNTYNIYPIILTLFIFYVFLSIFILRVIQYLYPAYYIYILILIIIILLIFTSLWFLYINSSFI